MFTWTKYFHHCTSNDYVYQLKGKSIIIICALMQHLIVLNVFPWRTVTHRPSASGNTTSCSGASHASRSAWRCRDLPEFHSDCSSTFSASLCSTHLFINIIGGDACRFRSGAGSFGLAAKDSEHVRCAVSFLLRLRQFFFLFKLNILVHFTGLTNHPRLLEVFPKRREVSIWQCGCFRSESSWCC